MGRKLSGVGYKRPPQSLSAALGAVLQKSMSMAVAGEDRKMTKLEAVMHTVCLAPKQGNGQPRRLAVF